MNTKKICINLNHKNGVQLNENAYSDFAVDVNWIMRSLYAGPAVRANLAIGGTSDQIMAFFTALQREKKYMDSYVKHGLNDAQTMTSKYQLDDAVHKFEFETGLKWPFVN
jgi:hypothetical protein